MMPPRGYAVLCFGRFVSPVLCLNAERERKQSTSAGGESAIDSLLGVSPVSVKKERMAWCGSGGNHRVDAPGDDDSGGAGYGAEAMARMRP